MLQPWLEERPDGSRKSQVRRPWQGKIRGDAYWLGWPPSLWATMVSTDLIRRHDLIFPTHRMATDACWLTRVLAHCPLEKVEFSTLDSYVWHWNGDSISRGGRGDARALDLWLERKEVFLQALESVARDLSLAGLITSRDGDILVWRHRSTWIRRLRWVAGQTRRSWREFAALPARCILTPLYWRLLGNLIAPPWLRRPSILFRRQRKVD